MCDVYVSRWVLLIGDEHSFLRLLVGVLVSFIFVMLLLVVRPYKQLSDNMLAS